MSSLGGKRELHNIHMLVLKNENTAFRNVIVRAAIALLYAHWEGFIKNVGVSYLNFIVNQRMKNKELPSHFLAAVVSDIVRKIEQSGKIQPCIDIIEFFRDSMDSRAKFDPTARIITESNLKSSVFHEVVKTLGLNYSGFATKEKLLDEKLLKNRNEIAHGQDLVISVAEYISLHVEITGMMQEFYNQIDNCVLLKSYRLV